MSMSACVINAEEFLCPDTPVVRPLRLRGYFAAEEQQEDCQEFEVVGKMNTDSGKLRKKRSVMAFLMERQNRG